HDREWKMAYQSHAPYAVLRTSALDFQTLQRLNRFAKFWDLYANSGNFPNTLARLKSLAQSRPSPSLFDEFWALTEFLESRHPHLHSIALVNLVKSAWVYLTEKRDLEREEVRQILLKDYTGYTKREVPEFLREEMRSIVQVTSTSPKSRRPQRQTR